MVQLPFAWQLLSKFMSINIRMQFVLFDVWLGVCLCVCVCASDVTLSMEQWVNYCGSFNLNKDGTSGISLCAYGEIGLLNWTQKHVRHWINIWIKSSRCGMSIEVGLSPKPKNHVEQKANKLKIKSEPKSHETLRMHSIKG